jgi:hypothetical protein
MLSHQDIGIEVTSAEVNEVAEKTRSEVSTAIEMTLGPERYLVLRR